MGWLGQCPSEKRTTQEMKELRELIDLKDRLAECTKVMREVATELLDMQWPVSSWRLGELADRLMVARAGR
jgi:hypothetical protein